MSRSRGAVPRPVRRGERATVALVAAHDEEDSIGQTVKELLALEGVQEVVVVADGCSDRTAELANGCGARVLTPPRRVGKGGALEGALDRVQPADIYLLIDGDVAETADEARLLLEVVAGGLADVAIGELPASQGGGFGLVKRMAAACIRALTGFRPLAPLSGQRALTREALFACRPLARGFGVETAMTIDAVRLGLRVLEVPVAMTHRSTGRSVAGFGHRARQGLDVLRAVLPRAVRAR
jgi:hypothetical protein